MRDFSQLLAEKIDTIVEEWIEAVRQSRQIESADELSRTAIQDHVPNVLNAVVSVLSQTTDNDIASLVQNSLQHGVLRAAQGFEPREIAQEYHLLQSTIFSALESGLLTGSSAEVIRVFRLIDAMVNGAIAQCFKSYTQERLQELKQLQSQLTLTNQELTRLVHAHQDNLSHLAHELKTPLNSIIGYSELFLRRQRQDSEVSEHSPSVENIERVLRNGRQLLHLVNDTLEFSRYENGKSQLRLTSTDVRSIINGVFQVMEPLTHLKELQMIVDCDDAPKQVLTDPFRLQQLVTNLLSNAVRYTKEGSIQVSCQVIPNNQWFIAVTDTGIGIAPEDQTRIFEPFFRANSSSDYRPPDSTGLGLAIVSQLVELLQGKISITSWRWLHLHCYLAAVSQNH